MVLLLSGGCTGPSDPPPDDRDASRAAAGLASASAWIDHDQDGWGGAPCSGDCDFEPTAGQGGDCDDINPEVHPEAEEACGAPDSDCDGEIDDGQPFAWHLDADGDGWGGPEVVEACEPPSEAYTLDGEDCDDADPTVKPSAIERCGGGDEDCDGLADDADPEGAVGGRASWIDGDGDGFGAEGSDATWVCELPEGRVGSGGDCDDADPDVNPDGTETCDRRDEDCDGLVDERAADRHRFYADADEDGHGDPTTWMYACAMPGWVEQADDCDDHNDLTHPTAAESCLERVDRNCDGLVGGVDHDGDGLAACDDCDDRDAALPGVESCNGVDDDCDGWIDDVAGEWLYPDDDRDGYGRTEDGIEACDLPAGWSRSGGDCDDADPAFHPDAAESDCADPQDYDCDGVIRADFDVDGDGSCAAEDCDDEDPDAHPGAAAETCTDGADLDCDGNMPPCPFDGPTVSLGGGAAARHLAVGDADGDGVDDLLLGDERAGTGAALLWLGPITSDLAVTDAALDWSSSTSSRIGSRFGLDAAGIAVGFVGTSTSGMDGGVQVFRSLSTTADLEVCAAYDLSVAGLHYGGDVDQDGAADLWLADSAVRTAWLLDGSASGTRPIDDATLRIYETDSDSQLGGQIHVGDIDGDGIDDLLLGDAGTSFNGVRAFIGPVLASAAAAAADGAWSTGESGAIGLAGGDLDEDGVADVIVTRPQYDGSGGRLIFVAGGPIGDLALADAAWTATGHLSEGLGTSVEVLGDGLVAAGAPSASPTGAREGTVYVFEVGAGAVMSHDAIIRWGGANAGEELGHALGVGDLDGDGAPDLVTAGDSRRAYVVPGSSW